uniref:AAC(3) family N-acetyltransferase n=1 Tax=Algoriphagus sp. TaxID=1872435 RepID=UPI00404813F2
MITNIYNLIANISPILEVFLRKIYWYNISSASSLKPKYSKPLVEHSELSDFNQVIDFIRKNGVNNGSIMVVHSSFDLLYRFNLNPDEVNQYLLNLVGQNGTLVMPVIRRFKEEGSVIDSLTKNLDHITCTYNVQKSLIVSGLLPYYLTKNPESFVSRFPLNPVVAVGAKAERMTKDNLNGDFPTPHGLNSAWKYCYDNNAFIVGLGVEMPHFLTMIHVNEECDSNWPIKDWYQKRRFIIEDKDFKTEMDIFERKPKWGRLYYAERKLRKDLIKSGILVIENIAGLEISVINSRLLIEFLKNNKRKGYPYYVESKHLIY